MVVVGASGDLGSCVLRELNLHGVTTVAVQRAGSPKSELPHPELNDYVHVVGAESGWPELPEHLARSSAVLNCAARLIDGSDAATLVLDNLRLAALVDYWGAKLELPVLQVSSGLLDHGRSDADGRLLGDRLAELVAAAPAAGRLMDDVADLCAGLSPRSPRQGYLLAKTAVEELVARRGRGMALRVSNFFGPGCRGMRLIPRLIDDRIRGINRSYPDEVRNYAYSEELGAFVRLCASEMAQDLRRGLVWAYGSHTVSVGELIRKLELILPNCYGVLSVEPGTRAQLGSVPDVPRMDDYFPGTDLFDRGSLDEQLTLTAHRWRAGMRYAPEAFVSPEVQREARELALTGGSVARKDRLSLPDGAGWLLVKSTSQLGFEGAGYPKLHAEASFFKGLASPANGTPSGLLGLYPRLVSAELSDDSATLRFSGHGDGTTAADALVFGPGLPRDQVHDLVRRAFLAGYLGDLRAVPPEEGRRQLVSMYLDRARGRLRGFLRQFASADRDSNARQLAGAVLDGDDVMVDDVLCDNPFTVLDEADEAPWARLVRPRSQGPCSHGDMTVLNMLRTTGPQPLLLIDPRGVTGLWDPVYDLGKTAFSLSGFTQCMRGALTWTRSEGGYLVTPVERPRAYRAGLVERAALDAWLEADPAFQPLRVLEPHLHERIAFAEAVHYLADTPYRFAQGSDADAALTVLLLGTKYLHLVVRQIRRTGIGRTGGDFE